jgi:uncharacterized protein (TIGR02757 family)
MTSPARRPLPVLASGRLARLHEALDAVRAGCDATERRRHDPVSFVHRHATPLDQELAGLLAASCAFGNVTTILGKLEEVGARLGPTLTAIGDDRAAACDAMRGFRHRLYVGEDLAHLLVGARRVQRRHGSLGAAFATIFAADVALQEALARFVDVLRDASEFPDAGERRGPAHLLPDPRGGSASKRLVLFLRWMVRPADGVDLGLWPVEPARLVMPVDVHVHKLARNLGLTRAASPSWRVAEEITDVFRRFDSCDPVKYDFALCHLGMASGCASSFVQEVCEPCAIRDVCSHALRSRRRSSTPRAVRAKVPPGHDHR